MSFILDTCVISELRKPAPDAGVLHWLAEVDAGELFVSVITLGEIEYGITRLAAGKHKQELMVWFEKLKDAFAPRVLPVTTTVALRWGEMRGRLRGAGVQLPVLDGLLAATAIEHDYLFVTRNLVDFQATAAKLHCPWTT